MITLGWEGGKIDGHTFQSTLFSHFYDCAWVAMAEAVMPSLYVRHPRVQDGGFWHFHMLDEGGLCRQNVQALGGGQGSVHEHGVTFVSNPTGHGVKMGASGKPLIYFFMLFVLFPAFLSKKSTLFEKY